MEPQLDLKPWRVDRICICRVRRRTFQGGKNNMNINARVGIVYMSTVSKEARGKDLQEPGQYRPIGAWTCILYITEYKCADEPLSIFQQGK